MCYNPEVQQSFYTSGFLYHSRSGQILLQQISSDNEGQLVLFRSKSRAGKDPQAAFKECVEDVLGVTIPESSIHPIYDYVHDRLGEQFIFYVEVSGAIPKTYSSKNKVEWFSLSKLSKINMSEQTRHDIIIGERVIRQKFESDKAPQNSSSH
jgi:hypothetical protein